MTRFRASILHFLISFSVGAFLLVLCWFVWYPAPMLTAIGGLEIFILMVTIDVILGPLLTLVIFNPHKKRRLILLDLTVIGVLQISAMCYGVNAILEARPAYVAALGDRFQVVQNNEITDENLNKAKTKVPFWGPTWVGTKSPDTASEKSQVEAVTSVGGCRGNLPQLHVPYQSMKAEILQKALNISNLKKNNPGKSEEIDDWLKQHQYSDQNVKYQPIKISTSNFAVIIDAKTVAVVGIAQFKP